MDYLDVCAKLVVFAIYLIVFSIIVTTPLADNLETSRSETVTLNNTIIAQQWMIDHLNRYNGRLLDEHNKLEIDLKSCNKALKSTEYDLYVCNEISKNINKPVPLQIADNIHKESSYLVNEWDCSDKTNEWVRRMRQQGYTDVNYTVGMVKLNDGSYGVHAWGCYRQCVEITDKVSPRLIEGVELGSTYIAQPWRRLIECEVC